MRHAFTMLELVIVIVVIGILAATVAPTFQRDTNAEAAQQFMSHVRYTQHLAMVEDKFDPTNPVWFIGRWQIRLDDGKYAIGSDSNLDSILIENELATDPLDSNKRLDGGIIATGDEISGNMDLTSEYDVTIASTGASGCSYAINTPLIISFDHLGRPLVGDISGDTISYPSNRLLAADCNLTFSGGSEDPVVVTITPETGYTFMN